MSHAWEFRRWCFLKCYFCFQFLSIWQPLFQTFNKFRFLLWYLWIRLSNILLKLWFNKDTGSKIKRVFSLFTPKSVRFFFRFSYRGVYVAKFYIGLMITVFFDFSLLSSTVFYCLTVETVKYSTVLLSRQ